MSEQLEKSSGATRLPSRREEEQDAARSRRLGVPTTAKPGQLTRGQRIIAGIKTFLWVAPLTLLIWVYAERAQRVELEQTGIIKTVRSASPSRIVSLIDPANGRVDLTLSGPRASLDQVRDAVNQIDLIIPDQFEAGQEISLNTADYIGRSESFSRAGVTVLRARPSTIRVLVQDRETKQVPVRMKTDPRMTMTAQFESEVVQISGPAPEVKGIEAVYADLSSVANFAPGVHVVEVPVLPQGVKTTLMTITPARVQATVTIQPSMSERLNSVPLYVTLPAVTLSQLGNWEISPQQTTVLGVKVVGPSETVQRLISGETLARVEIELGPDQLREQTIPFTLKQGNYRMPAGVTVENPEQTVTIRISRR